MLFNAVGAIASQVKKFINAIANGNFVNTTGWSSTGSSSSASDNILTNTANGTSASPRIERNSELDCVSGKKIFMYAILSVSNASCTKVFITAYGSTTTGTSQEIKQDNPVNGQSYELYGVKTIPANAVGKVRIQTGHTYASAAASNGLQATIQKVIIYDLTAAGLDGNDAAWCLANIVPNISW